MLRNTMTHNFISLCCLVDGESTSFEVDIESTRTINCLKRAIKIEMSPRFDDITANDLTLWKVSVPVAPKKERKEISLADVPSKEELYETDDVSEVFDEQPPGKTIHIIVLRPPQSNTRTRLLIFVFLS